jgi:hypothetical protein
MTVLELAKFCSCSPRQIYVLRAKFPDEAPPFKESEKWKDFVVAHKVVTSGKRHAPRRTPDLQSDHARYIAARADRTESLAASERVRLAVTKRDMIPRIEEEAAFITVANRLKARLRRLVNDAPSILLGFQQANCSLWKSNWMNYPAGEKGFRIPGVEVSLIAHCQLEPRE